MILLSSEELERSAVLLKSIAHPVRLGIVNHLAEVKTCSVNDLAEIFKIDQPLMSHHLGQMRLRGVLKTEKLGKTVIYSLREPHLIQLLECIRKCNCHF